MGMGMSYQVVSSLLYEFIHFFTYSINGSVYGIDPNRIYATYFGGDTKQGLAPDEEARQIWSRFLPAERILPFGCKDNFWEMVLTTHNSRTFLCIYSLIYREQLVHVVLVLKFIMIALVIVMHLH